MEWPRPVARRNLRSGRAFSGDVMNCGVWMSPVEARWRIVRCILSSWHSRRRWCVVTRSMPHGQGSAVMLGGGSVGARLQKCQNKEASGDEEVSRDEEASGDEEASRDEEASVHD